MWCAAEPSWIIGARMMYSKHLYCELARCDVCDASNPSLNPQPIHLPPQPNPHPPLQQRTPTPQIRTTHLLRCTHQLPSHMRRIHARTDHPLDPLPIPLIPLPQPHHPPLISLLSDDRTTGTHQLRRIHIPQRRRRTAPVLSTAGPALDPVAQPSILSPRAPGLGDSSDRLARLLLGDVPPV